MYLGQATLYYTLRIEGSGEVVFPQNDEKITGFDNHGTVIIGSGITVVGAENLKGTVINNGTVEAEGGSTAQTPVLRAKATGGDLWIFCDCLNPESEGYYTLQLTATDAATLALSESCTAADLKKGVQLANDDVLMNLATGSYTLSLVDSNGNSVETNVLHLNKLAFALPDSLSYSTDDNVSYTLKANYSNPVPDLSASGMSFWLRDTSNNQNAEKFPLSFRGDNTADCKIQLNQVTKVTLYAQKLSIDTSGDVTVVGAVKEYSKNTNGYSYPIPWWWWWNTSGGRAGYPA